MSARQGFERVLKAVRLTGLAVSLAAGQVISAAAAELVMFESESCEWCEAWHEQIGPAYPNTEESRVAPLRRVDIDKDIPDDLRHVKAVHYTPTFVLIEEGREVGRIIGYPGQDFFWPLLAEEIAKLKPVAGQTGKSVAGACDEQRTRETTDEKNGDRAASC